MRPKSALTLTPFLNGKVISDKKRLDISSVRLKIKQNQLLIWLWWNASVGVWLQGA